MFGLSIAAASVTVLLLLMFAATVLWTMPSFRLLLDILARNIGVFPISVFVGGILFLIYFFLFSQRSIGYIEEISQGLEEIAEGHLDKRIVIRGNDELGALAENINQMAGSLKHSMQEERKAEKTKSDLVTSVSHDLRTPLTSILGYLELIVKDNYRDEVVLRHYADIAYAKAQRLKNLVEELFEYTRVSYGGMRLNMQSINIVELLQQLVEDFVPLLEETGMVCRLEAKEKELFIEADGHMLARVFENLMMNAIRYGSDGKYLDICIKAEDKVVISFTNYGEPIPVVDLPFIFERFYKVEKSRSEEQGGTGLGLAIAKNILELHKGEIAAYSDHKGTTFEVKLVSGGRFS